MDAAIGVVFGDIGTSPLYAFKKKLNPEHGLAFTPEAVLRADHDGEGVLNPGLERYVIPIAVVILVMLFLVRRKGTAAVGKVFGPVMVLWFLLLAVEAAAQVWRQPQVLAPLDPRHAFGFLFTHRAQALPVAGFGRSRVHRRRGLVCRHGAFRRAADPAGLDIRRAAGPGARLFQAGRAGTGQSVSHRHPVPAVVSVLERAADGGAGRDG
ncbi:MAG: KUP/HAK/KT family potassium transporter [Janthinobacterium lividum]